MNNPISIDFTIAASDRVRDIQKRLGASNPADAIRTCLRLSEWILRQLDDGWELQIAKDDQVRVVEILTKEPTP